MDTQRKQAKPKRRKRYGPRQEPPPLDPRDPEVIEHFRERELEWLMSAPAGSDMGKYVSDLPSEADR